MAVSGRKAENQLKEITECPICMSAFTDPRVLPCIHTFCFGCLERNADAAQNKPGQRMPCPLCRKEFTIPEDGMNGIQKNFFMENLLEYKNTLQMESATAICNMSNVRIEGETGQIPTAIVGNIKEATTQFENCAIVVGLEDDSLTITEDVIKIYLHRPNETSTQEQIPTKMDEEVYAAVYCNTMYVTGVGANNDENWKYKESSGWKKCASLVQGRIRHSAAFINEVLYLCGGLVGSTKNVLDTVEAYNAITDKCVAVGKLVYCVQNSGNCVPFRRSLYIFGGADKDYEAFDHVQVYNTNENTCSVLSRPIPEPSLLMRAIVWETSVILLDRDTCFIFNFETEMWKERKQFKTDVIHLGVVLANGRVFAIGGGNDETDEAGKETWKCRDDVRYVPLQNILQDKPIEWKIHGKLPKPSLVYAFGRMQ